MRSILSIALAAFVMTFGASQALAQDKAKSKGTAAEATAMVQKAIAHIKKAGRWQDYKFMNPTSRAFEPKSMYLQRYEDLIVGCGISKS